MKKSMKTGISLIVMLITIVVIIILATSIVNTVIYNDPMDNAKEATFRSDLQEMKNAYGIRQSDLMAKYKGDITKIKEEDYAGVVFEQYKNEVLAFEDGLAYLGEDKKKQEIAESMDYIIGNPNDSVLRAWPQYSQDDFHNTKYRTKITKIKFITNNKVPNEAVESWDVSEKNNGLVMAWVVDDGNDGYELTIGGFRKVIANTKSLWMIGGFTALKEIDIKVLDTSNVTDMGTMFWSCPNLESIDLSNFDTSNVKSMWCMFKECAKLKNINLSSFDTSKVENMSSVFYNCSSLTDLDISNFDTGNVTNMWGMFVNCRSLTDLDISNFKTSSVITMQEMFKGCSNLINLHISDFDTCKVTNMSNMFNGCKKLKATITIKNTETSIYDLMFSQAATESGAEIKVNYTSTTEALVDKMLETKSEKSNVIKGELVS